MAYNITSIKTPNQLTQLDSNYLSSSSMLVNHSNELKTIAFNTFKTILLNNINNPNIDIMLNDYYTKYNTSSNIELYNEFLSVRNVLDTSFETISNYISGIAYDLAYNIELISSTSANQQQYGLIKATPSTGGTAATKYYLNIENSIMSNKFGHGFINITDFQRIDNELQNIQNDIKRLYDQQFDNTSDTNLCMSNDEITYIVDKLNDYTYGDRYIRINTYEISADENNNIIYDALYKILSENNVDQSILSLFIECISDDDNFLDSDVLQPITYDKWKILSSDSDPNSVIIDNIELSTIGIVNNGLAVKYDKLLIYDINYNDGTASTLFSYKLSTLNLQQELGGFINTLSCEYTELSLNLSNEISTLSDTVNSISSNLSNDIEILSSNLFDFMRILNNYTIEPETLSIAISSDSETDLQIIKRDLLILKPKE